MNEYTLLRYGQAVGVQSNTDLSPSFVELEKQPHLRGLRLSQGGTHEFNIKYINAPQRPAIYSRKTAVITLPIHCPEASEAVLYAALPFLEVLHQRERTVTAHAAAIEIGGKAILLLGQAGAGKTSIVLSLCRNFGARLIGNDIVKVGLNNGQVIACEGSKFFFLRQESIKRNTPDLLDLFPDSDKDSWTHKIYCLPEQLGICICPQQIPVTYSYLVHVDETKSNVYTASANQMQTRLYLSENLSRYIRGSALTLFGPDPKFMGYVPSLDTPKFFEMRTRLIESILTVTNMKYLSGNLRDTCKYIIEEAGI